MFSATHQITPKRVIKRDIIKFTFFSNGGIKLHKIVRGTFFQFVDVANHFLRFFSIYMWRRQLEVYFQGCTGTLPTFNNFPTRLCRSMLHLKYCQQSYQDNPKFMKPIIDKLLRH